MNTELQAAYGQFDAARELLLKALEREISRANGASVVKLKTERRVLCGGLAMKMAQEIADQYGVTVRRLMSPDRRRDVAHPRQHLMAALYASGRYSLPAIGQFLGGRDHTTVLHGIRAHSKRMADLMREAA